MKVVGKALRGKGERAQHEHPVVLTGKFKKEEMREKAHRVKKATRHSLRQSLR
jgi:hypothetical protein